MSAVGSEKGTIDSIERPFPLRGSLFGSPGRTDLLVLIAALGRSFPRELARLTKMPMSTVIRNLNELERAGVLAGVRLGSTRELRLNPEFIAARELKVLLDALAERVPKYREIIGREARRRPRRSSKPL